MNAPADHPSPAAAGVGSLPRITAVVVAYGPEEWLEKSVAAVLASEGVDVDVVLVDNGGTEGMVDRLEHHDGVTVVRPDHNVGFATGCNLGVAASDAPYVALVNPDAIVEPDALAIQVGAAADPSVGLTTAGVRLADAPDRLNSAGGMVHFLGVSWAGWFDEPADRHTERVPVAAASGAALVCRREVWEALGGFCDELFAYCEDADLSLRAWQQGWTVLFVPEAVVTHRYEFSRNPIKYRLLERNRIVMTVSCFSTRHLLLILPLLLGLELGTLAYAARHGWLGEKLKAYLWLLRHVSWLRRRRRTVQAARTRSGRELAHLFSEHLQPANLDLPSYILPIDRVLTAYWRAVRRFV